MLLLLPAFVASRVTAVGAAGRLFPLHYEQLRRAFHAALSWLHLTHVPFTLHSLRHGGATHDSLNGVPIANIIKKGRWSDPRSAAVYLQTGRALFLSVDVPPATASRLTVYGRAISRFEQGGGSAATSP